MIARADYGGHVYFGPWRTPHDPTTYEHGIGPCEEVHFDQVVIRGMG